MSLSMEAKADRISSIVIVHGGQTGVDRGAHWGAIDAGLAVDGFMTSDARDERGLVPQDVAKHLRRHTTSSYSERTKTNVDFADALLVVVPDVDRPDRTVGTRLTLRLAEARQLPMIVAGQDSTGAALLEEIFLLPDEWWTSGTQRLMVAGPRASTWRRGHDIAKYLVASIVKPT